jgi:hypothetical protein
MHLLLCFFFSELRNNPDVKLTIFVLSFGLNDSNKQTNKQKNKKTGPTSDHYEWIIVSGGPPTESYPDGCTTKLTGVNGAGLWLFSR